MDIPTATSIDAADSGRSDLAPGSEHAAIGHIESMQGVPVLRLTGELDLLSCPRLEHLLRPVVCSAALTVVVDTSAVTFIDCAGLRPLLQAAVDLRRRQARLLMLHPSTPVLRLSALTGSCELLDLTSAPALDRSQKLHPTTP